MGSSAKCVFLLTEMHTLIIISTGLLVLAVFLLFGRYAGGSTSRMARSAIWFLPFWLAASAINLRIGVSTAGYTLAQEFPIFLLVFGLPAMVAVVVWRVARSP